MHLVAIFPQFNTKRLTNDIIKMLFTIETTSVSMLKGAMGRACESGTPFSHDCSML